MYMALNYAGKPKCNSFERQRGQRGQNDFPVKNYFTPDGKSVLVPFLYCRV
jgi:hypothetical protein